MVLSATADTPTITGLRSLASSLEVTWADGVTTRYPWIWLRDHAHDDDTMHPFTQQRQLFTAAVPLDICGGKVQVVDEALQVDWAAATEPTSIVPVAFLASYRTPRPARIDPESTPVLWDAGLTTPAISHEAVMHSDEGVAEWLANVARYGFCIVTGTPPTMADSEALLRRVGYVRETIFGGFWDFTADLTKADTAYTNLELRPHTDGTYANDAPGAQMLHCLHFDGTGGESTMVDAFALAQRLRRETPEHYATLSNVVVPGQYIGDGSHLMAARPVLRHDHTGALAQVSFNNYDRAPFLLEEDDMMAFYAALQAFDRIANDPTMQWRHVLAPGEALLFDNWRVLHGRAAFTGSRHMCGGYVNREDMHSRLRQIRPSV